MFRVSGSTDPARKKTTSGPVLERSATKPQARAITTLYFGPSLLSILATILLTDHMRIGSIVKSATEQISAAGLLVVVPLAFYFLSQYAVEGAWGKGCGSRNVLKGHSFSDCCKGPQD
jgi:hypothetical protein